MSHLGVKRPLIGKLVFAMFFILDILVQMSDFAMTTFIGVNLMKKTPPPSWYSDAEYAQGYIFLVYLFL